MVRIPFRRRQPKPDSSQGEDGKKTSLPGSLPEKDRPAQQFVLGTDKKIPFPLKPPSEHEVTQPPRTAVVEKTSIPLTLPDKDATANPPEAAFVARVIVPESRPEPPEVTQMPDEAVGEETSVTLEPPEKEAEKQPVDAAAISETPLPESRPEHHEATQPSEAAVVEKTASVGSLPDKHQPGQLSGVGITQAGVDALAILQAMPDYIFRIGHNGVSPVVSDDSRAGVGVASRGTGINGFHDGKATANEKDKARTLEKIILEELPRQSEQQAKRVLETRQSETFEFEVRDDKEVRHLEVRLTAFGESEVLAFVRDVTLLRQTHNALIESRTELENHLKERNAELIRVNRMLKTEVELRVEQEEILKKNFHRLEGLLEDTIGTITLIVEKKDPHVADHQRRVSQLACAIGQEMKLRNDQMRAVRMAAQLHDLGKIFIPAEILRKPGKLTEAEMSVVKTHPDTDYQILKRIDFPISIADIVRQHHERMNGSGYPQGLKGDGILVEARILGVADSIEGMVFERPYRVAPGLEAALKEITDQKGTLYDPAVVDSCLKLFAEERFKFEPSPGQQSAKSGGEPRHESLVSVGRAPDRRDL